MKLKEKIAFIQQAIDGLSKDANNPFFKSKYVELNQIIDALRPLELEQKISITMPLATIEGRPAVSLEITDLETDEIQTSSIVIPDLQDPQKMGSAITYFRRYSLMSFFNLKAEDDDAESTKPAKGSSVDKKYNEAITESGNEWGKGKIVSKSESLARKAAEDNKIKSSKELTDAELGF